MKLYKLVLLSIPIYLISICILCIISGVIGSICIPYVINTWLVYFGKTATVTALNGFLIGLFPPAGFGSIIATIITWVAMLFL